MRSKIKKISLIVIISSLLASISAVFSVFILNSNNKVKVESKNDKLLLNKYFENKNNILCLLINEENKLVFNDFLIKTNLKKVVTKAISESSYFKINNFDIKDIDLNIKYILKTKYELMLNIEYGFSQNVNKEESMFKIKIF